MIIRTFYDSKLAQASYMVGCSASGQAVVIDPSRDSDPYLDMADSLGLRITAITETHIHADYVSGTRQLSAATGATMYLSAEGGPVWQYGFVGDPLAVPLRDGDAIHVGNVSLRAVHTPGHTPEHLAFLLTDHPTSDLPHSLFAGDFVFVGDVGRPDLLELAANIAGTMEEGARQLFRSLRKLEPLPDSLLLWPGHGAGSSCGKSLGGSPVTTLGYERATNWALLTNMEDQFVDEILSGQPEPPHYFKEMKRVNKVGPTVLDSAPNPQRVTTLVGQIVDVRGFDDVRRHCYNGTVAIPYCNSFTGYAGWVIGYKEPVTLIADSQERACQAVRDLAAIGIDQVIGWVHPHDLVHVKASPIPVVTGGSIRQSDFVLDVRGGRERSESHVKGSVHIHFGQLRQRLDELPRDQRIVVYCASGGRSPIACSILLSAGFKNVQELADGLDSIEADWPELIHRP